MDRPPFPICSPANDDANAVRPRSWRLVPLIGTLHVDEGRLERHQVVELLRIPTRWLRAWRHG